MHNTDQNSNNITEPNESTTPSVIHELACNDAHEEVEVNNAHETFSNQEHLKELMAREIKIYQLQDKITKMESEQKEQLNEKKALHRQVKFLESNVKNLTEKCENLETILFDSKDRPSQEKVNILISVYLCFLSNISSG